MKHLSKIFISTLLITSMALSSVGCGKTETEIIEEPQSFVEQNDWGGCFSRLAKVQQDVMNSVSVLNTHNYEIIQGNPTDYWDEDEFYYLNFVPMYSDELAYTAALNEVQDFTVIQTNVNNAVVAAGFAGGNAQRIDEHHYSVTYDGNRTHPITGELKYARTNLECIYDAGHNWLQLDGTTQFDFDSVQITHLYEFAEVDANKYVFQNDKERMYVEYNEDKTLKEYYYSCRPAVKEEEELLEEAESSESTFEDFMFGDIQEEETEVPDDVEIYEEKYTVENNSIYRHLNECNSDWVFAAEEFQTQITYKNNELSVSVQNKLTEETESFVVKVTIPEQAEATVSQNMMQ